MLFIISMVLYKTLKSNAKRMRHDMQTTLAWHEFVIVKILIGSYRV